MKKIIVPLLYLFIPILLVPILTNIILPFMIIMIFKIEHEPFNIISMEAIFRVVTIVAYSIASYMAMFHNRPRIIGKIDIKIKFLIYVIWAIIIIICPQKFEFWH
jgi:hypothetical protein